jgi:hypothetical protein
MLTATGGGRNALPRPQAARPTHRRSQLLVTPARRRFPPQPARFRKQDKDQLPSEASDQGRQEAAAVTQPAAAAPQKTGVNSRSQEKVAQHAANGGGGSIPKRRRDPQLRSTHPKQTPTTSNIQPTVASRLQSVLSDPNTQAACYGSLAAASALASLAALSAPALLCSWLFGEQLVRAGSSQLSYFTRWVGATLVASTAVKFTLRVSEKLDVLALLVPSTPFFQLPTSSSLQLSVHTTICQPTAQEAALRGQLSLPTFRRLNCALMLQSALGLTVLTQGVSVRTPQLTGAYLCPSVFVCVCLCVSVYVQVVCVCFADHNQQATAHQPSIQLLNPCSICRRPLWRHPPDLLEDLRPRPSRPTPARPPRYCQRAAGGSVAQERDRTAVCCRAGVAAADGGVGVGVGSGQGEPAGEPVGGGCETVG